MFMIRKICHEIYYSLQNYPRFLYGLWKLFQMPDPKVTVFGGKRAQPESRFYHQAKECGKLLAQKNFSVLTGGGPGIMEAVLCGVLESNKPKINALGIGVISIDPTFKSHCGYDIINVSDFTARKWLLIHYSIGFIIFPGGLGTLNEAAEVLDLIKTHRLPKLPIIFVGKEFWRSLIDWLDVSTNEALILPEFRTMIQSTDDISEAIAIIEQKMGKND